MSTFLIIILLLAGAWFWLDSARAREMAMGICREASQHYQVQLLDESVVLSRISLRWPDEGLRVWRLYTFDFSHHGDDRRQGKLALTGINLDYVDFDFAVVDGEATADPTEQRVIPFKKKDS